MRKRGLGYSERRVLMAIPFDRCVTELEIAEETGIHRQSVEDLINNQLLHNYVEQRPMSFSRPYLVGYRRIGTNSQNINGPPEILRVPLRDYVAGALVANAPMWLLSIVLQYLKIDLSFVFLGLTLYFTAMAGSTLAGYLLERKRGLGYRKTGIPTGFTAYALYSIYLTVVRVRGGVLEDFLPLMGFVIGGAIGARYREKQNRS